MDDGCQDIVQKLSQGHLVACSDGAYDKKKATSSHVQVFASGLVCNIVATCIGQVDGHPALLSSYRSELSGILATLYIVFCIC
jgi:formate/nitrite transporter FocA (FNT family)